jgi:hypothetical protein
LRWTDVYLGNPPVHIRVDH